LAEAELQDLEVKDGELQNLTLEPGSIRSLTPLGRSGGLAPVKTARNTAAELFGEQGFPS